MMLPRPLSALVRIGIVVASVAALVMMALGAGDALATFFSRPVPGALEFAELLMVLVVFLALPDAEANRKHIAIDIVSRRLPQLLSRPVAVFSGLLTLGFYGAMAWQAWRLFAYSWSVGEFTAGLVKFPVYPAKGMLVLALAVVTAVAAINLMKTIFGTEDSHETV